jgi:molybdopterin molybdotransferase
MASDHQSPQRIARLAPLTDAAMWIDANVHAAVSRDVGVTEASGYTLASDVKIPDAIPSGTISLRDGYALQSDWTSDASSYAPAPLPQMPARIDAGDSLPAGADCVAALDHVAIKGDRAEALAVVAPGDGILPAGGDIAAGRPFLRSGQRLRASDIAVLRAANVASVSIRAPRIVVAASAGDAIIAAAAAMIGSHIHASGGTVISGSSLEAALATDADAIISIGGTGAGKDDASVTTLSRPGKVVFHGIGLSPGETAAIGEATGKPVLLMPGRIDAALACWLLLGQRVFARLAGCGMDDVTMPLKLTRKITSTIGIADVVLLTRNGGDAEPIASGYWPLQALAQADTYCVVPPESEGFPAGATISASPLP